MVNPILDQFNSFLQREGKDIIVNDNNVFKGLIREIEDSATNDTKNIYMPLYTLEQGYKVNVLGKDWLCTKKDINSNEVYEKGTIELCNDTLNFNFEGDIKPMQAIVNFNNKDLEKDGLVMLYDGDLFVILNDNPDSQRIDLQQRFISQNKAWEVIGRDYTRNGLIVLSCDMTEFNSDDDIDNKIADRWKYETKHEYVITIKDKDNILVFNGQTYTLEVSLTDMEQDVNPLPELVFTSDDESIVTVDNNGVITGVGLGTANITVQLAENLQIATTTSVGVEEIPMEDDYSVTITDTFGQNDYIRLNQTLTYVATVTNNGQVVNDKAVIWSVANQDGTSKPYFEILSQSDNEIKIKSTSDFNYVHKYFVVSAKLVDDETIENEIVVMVKGAW